ncbi:MAG: hydantoinase/oxoprolinase family protein [bacterium]
MVTIGVDTGGTFTDFIFKDRDGWGVYKVLSTPRNPAEAILEGLSRIATDVKTRRVVHGSTVATNAILERKGVKTALVTNKGFEDIIEIGRQSRDSLYDLACRKEPPVVPESLRFGVRERTICTGEALEPLDMEEANSMLPKIRESGAESVAICFLFSYLNPAHEKVMGELLGDLNIPFSLSHEILAEFREYERTSTTVINAYVSPRMKGYVSHIIKSLGETDSLRIMQSNGGSISAETAMKESVRTILSGPAGGAVGAYEMGRMAGFHKIISFDMGGTSTDVSLMDSQLSLTLESRIAGYPVKVPMIDIHTVGAGGGSVVYVDSGGALRVGPESAGADPGPICYGKGDRITVTDAHLYLGRLVPEHFLGGGMRLQAGRLDPYFRQMGEELSLSPTELAEGILSVANTAMERAIRVISMERGYDPREFTLFTFGGAGGLHTAYLARLLCIPKVLVPKNPGILSAIGMLMADIIKDYSLTLMRNQTVIKKEGLSELFHDLEEKGKNDLIAEGIDENAIVLERFLDMRYAGQSHEIIVPCTGDYREGFHMLHEKKYGYRNRDKAVEVVNLRLRVRGSPEKPEFKKSLKSFKRVPDEALLGEKEVIFEGRYLKTPILQRERILTGNKIKGPAILVEYSSTIVVPPFADAYVDEYGNIIMGIR